MLDQYQPILAGIQAIEPLAHIAGGAVRDTILNRPIKDIDVFLDYRHIDTAAEMLHSKFGYAGETREWTKYQDFSDPVVVHVTNFEKTGETIPLSLIGLDEPKPMQMNADRFDFGICMAAWDGEKVYTANAFDTDVANKTFTLLRADDEMQFAYSMSRFKKLTTDRYRGYILSVPLEFEALAKTHALQSKRIALHEAGHAVAAVHHMVAFEYVTVVPDGSCNGHVKMCLEHDDSDADLIVSLAGPAVDKKWWPYSSLLLGYGHYEISKTRRRAEISQDHFNFLQWLTKKFVEEFGHEIEMLAAALIERETLTSDEVSHVLAKA
jgi:Poly A polymerase head domain